MERIIDQLREIITDQDDYEARLTAQMGHCLGANQPWGLSLPSKSWEPIKTFGGGRYRKKMSRKGKPF